MTEVIMPKMGDGMEEGTLLEWLKKEGDKVKSGEIIGTIQTDKATLELEAPGSGVLTGIITQGGETIPVGKPMAAIVKDGEKLPKDWGSGGGAPKSNGSAESKPAEQPTSGGSKEGSGIQDVPAGVEAAQSQSASAPSAAPAESGRIKASPLAKKIAAERGIDLSTINGSGPGGRIVEKDVTSAQPMPAPTKVAEPQLITATAEDQKIKLNRIRQITAQRTAESKQQVPHFYVTVEVDLENLMDLREMFVNDEAGKLSINDFVIRACVMALQQMPQVNSSYQGDSILQYGAINIGLAVALDDGLTLPVMKNAQAMTLRQISARSKELAGKARDNKLSPDELSGSTFSISNMGMLNVDEFIAIINQPNAAILAVSSAKKKPVVNAEDELEIRWQMNISASFDHRVVDGAVGAKFINLIRDFLENPTRLLS